MHDKEKENLLKKEQMRQEGWLYDRSLQTLQQSGTPAQL